MINSENLCMSCMREIGENEQQCPHCGYYVGTKQIEPYLPVRTLLANRYIIGKLLEYNGDGATYISWDIKSRQPVTVREFLPDTLCGRVSQSKKVTVLPGCDVAYTDCMAEFTELWQKLTRMSGLSALENVTDVFRENNTVYAVSDYVESISLRDYLLRIKTGYIPWEKAQSLFMPVLSTLGMLHTAGIIHRGLSPLTMHIGRDGKMRIGGFSIWQARTARGELTAQLFPGYAAVEQYGADYQQGPWTDIYAFGATLYRALIGSDPIEATERLINDRLMVPGKFAEQLPAYVINGLINALQILPEERTRTVEQLRAELSAAPAVSSSGFTDVYDQDTAYYSGKIAPTAPTSGNKDAKKPAKKKPAGKKKDDSSSKKTVIRTALISAIVLLAAFVVLVIAKPDLIGLGKEVTTEENTTRGEMVTVPNFVKRDISEITGTAYWTKNFVFEKEEEYSDTIEKGCVIAQSIKEGTEVNAGTKIVLTVSLGIEQFILPEVLGLSYDNAKALLQERNFQVSKEEMSNDGTHAPGTVQNVLNLTIGKSYPKGTLVHLVVWGPPEPQTEPPTTEPETTTEPPTTQPEEDTTSPYIDSPDDPDTTTGEGDPSTDIPYLPTEADYTLPEWNLGQLLGLG